jgi:hypothetical protein
MTGVGVPTATQTFVDYITQASCDDNNVIDPFYCKIPSKIRIPVCSGEIAVCQVGLLVLV